MPTGIVVMAAVELLKLIVSLIDVNIINSGKVS